MSCFIIQTVLYLRISEIRVYKHSTVGFSSLFGVYLEEMLQNIIQRFAEMKYTLADVTLF